MRIDTASDGPAWLGDQLSDRSENRSAEQGGHHPSAAELPGGDDASMTGRRLIGATNGGVEPSDPPDLVRGSRGTALIPLPGDKISARRRPSGKPGRNKFDENELFRFAQELDFSGPAWEILERSLVAYALGAMQEWATSGEALRVAVEQRVLRRPLTSEELLRWLVSDQHIRSDSITSAVAKALRQFTQTIRGGRGWHPDGKISLTTVFLDRCIFMFTDELLNAIEERYI